MSFSEWPGYRPGHHWKCGDDRTTFSRPLGVLEQRFDIASTQKGQSDTFVRLNLDLEASGANEGQTSRFVFRLIIAWSRLRTRHPLLGATIEDEATTVIPGCPARRFNYKPPDSASEAIDQALNTLLVDQTDDLRSRMDAIQDKYILNGDRVLLSQSECLARLILVEDQMSNGKFGFFLVISHVISDGISVFKLVAELFEIASTIVLPSSPPDLSPLSLDHFLKGTRCQPAAISADLEALFPTTLLESETFALLPLALEDHLPSLPLATTPSLPTIQPIEAPKDTHASDSVPRPTTSLPRRRWIWAITRTVTLARQRKTPHSLHIPRISSTRPPTQAKTRWELLRFSKESSSKLFRFCKSQGLSPSMLLYAMLATSTANLFATLHRSHPYRPILVGFPFSARRFLEKAFSPSSDPSFDLAIRITFGSIHLPNLPLDANSESSAIVRSAIARTARLAKKQFERKLAPDHTSRTVFLANSDFLNIDRLLTRYKLTPPPWEDPKTCINASMIGDVDRILPTSFRVSPEDYTITLSDLQIGTRLHLGEGNFNEGLTWDGMLQFCMGIDDQFIKTEYIEAILDGIRKIGLAIGAGEEREQS